MFTLTDSFSLSDGEHGIGQVNTGGQVIHLGKKPGCFFLPAAYHPLGSADTELTIVYPLNKAQIEVQKYERHGTDGNGASGLTSPLCGLIQRYKSQCSKAAGNRIVRMNEELTRFHEEVLANLNCVHGALLRMNRSIQAEGAFGTIQWNRACTRARRRGLEGLLLETALISCGFNLHKFHLKPLARPAAAMPDMKL